jgi:uncharacterized protein YbaA (DUF1428 family)
MRVIGDAMGYHISSVSRAVRDVSNALWYSWTIYHLRAVRDVSNALWYSWTIYHLRAVRDVSNALCDIAGQYITWEQ